MTDTDMANLASPMDKLLLAIENLKAQPDLHGAIAGMPLAASDDATSLGSDGERLMYSPEFVDRCDQDQVDYLVAFNAMMQFENVMARGKQPETDLQAWQMAANLVVNRKMRQRGYVCTIPGTIDDPEQDGLDIETLYERLRDEPGRKAMDALMAKVASCNMPVADATA